MNQKIRLTTLLVTLVCGAAMAQNPVKAPGRKTTGPTHDPASALSGKFGGNLAVNTCTGCDFDELNGGYFVWGLNNCETPGTTQWIGVPFVAKVGGVPRQISAGIELDPACPASTTQVTLGLYADDCTTGVGTLLTSARAVVSAGPCIKAVARLRNAPALVAGTRYWVAATTTAQQDGLSAIWYGSNESQIGGNVASGGWFFFNGFVPSFQVD